MLALPAVFRVRLLGIRAMTNAKRKLKRVRLICSPEVYDALDGRLLGLLDDISVEGISLRGPIFMQTNAVRRVRVRLPCEIEGRTEIETDAECMWACKSDLPDLFDSGMRFVDPLPDVVEVIEILLRRFQR